MVRASVSVVGVCPAFALPSLDYLGVNEEEMG